MGKLVEDFNTSERALKQTVVISWAERSETSEE